MDGVNTGALETTCLSLVLIPCLQQNNLGDDFYFL